MTLKEFWSDLCEEWAAFTVPERLAIGLFLVLLLFLAFAPLVSASPVIYPEDLEPEIGMTRPALDGCNMEIYMGNGNWSRTLARCVPNPTATMDVTDTCHMKMEAAMRAMDPFIDWFTRLNESHLDMDDQATLHALSEAYQRWQKTKETCWAH